MYKEYGFFERLSKIEEDFPGANIILHKYGVLPQVSKQHLFSALLTTKECSRLSSSTDLHWVFGYQIFDIEIEERCTEMSLVL